MRAALVDALLATVPALIVATVTWKVIWPRWKRVGQLVLQPVLFFTLALVIGHWSVLLAWAYQAGVLAGHVWFSKQHGFTWYAVEDPERYVALSKAAVEASARRRTPSP